MCSHSQSKSSNWQLCQFSFSFQCSVDFPSIIKIILMNFNMMIDMFDLNFAYIASFHLFLMNTSNVLLKLFFLTSFKITLTTTVALHHVMNRIYMISHGPRATEGFVAYITS